MYTFSENIKIVLTKILTNIHINYIYILKIIKEREEIILEEYFLKLLRTY
jgi:hypothetical protein